MRTSEASPSRLSPAHFAYLRAWAEGLDRSDAARRYLGLEHGHQLRTLHDQAVDQLRAIARRAGDSRWRLIGLDVGAVSRRGPQSAQPAGTAPTLEQWVEARGLADWSHAEQLAMYREAHPPSAAGAAAAKGERKLARAARLRQRQLAVLAELERAAAVAPLPTDPVDAWVDPLTAQRLQRAGFSLLGEVRIAARRGGRWWRGMPGVGVKKAARIAAFVDHLLPSSPPRSICLVQDKSSTPLAALVPAASDPESAARALPRLPAALDGSAGSNRAARRPAIDAQTDLQAIRSWITARARSPRTAAVYEREALRWLLWCTLERSKPLSSAGPDDCTGYMAFLQRVPEHWIHRGRRDRLAESWTPCRGQLGLAARRLAVTVLNIMCAWLVDHAHYLASNPWAAVQRGLVDGAEQPTPRTSRALTPEAYEALVRHATREARQPEEFPAAARNLFVLRWMRHTGMRAAELLAARRGDMRRSRAGWLIGVVGKGAKAREVSVPTPAVDALRVYLAHRGQPRLEDCGPDTPLVVSLAAGGASYSAIHKSFVRFIQRALRASDLTPADRAQAARATQHWLRHTYATRFAEAGGAQDVLMAELGHSSPTTTAGYYTAQIERRQNEVERLAKS